MLVKDFSVEPPEISASQILKAIEIAVPPEEIDQAIALTGCSEDRNRKLPTHLVICLIIAMSLWASDSMKDVLKNLMDGLKRFREIVESQGRVPVKSAITKARKRVGPRVMSVLFNKLTRPLATEQTPGAFLRGKRIVLIDGTTINLPDSSENARVFGYPGTRKGTKAAFPKARIVMLIEGGTHLIFDALMSPYRMGEAPRARILLRSVTSGMLVMWDRGLHSYMMVDGVIEKQAAFLGRVPAHVKFKVEQVRPDGSYLSYIYSAKKLKKKEKQPILVRVIEYQVDNPDSPEKPEVIRVITNLFDVEQFPADLLAQDYHQRWEAENTIDEVKTHLNGRKTPIRSLNPREVVQEVYGWLLGHWAVRCLMFQAAQQEGISPLRLSFTSSLKVIRRAIPNFQKTQPSEQPDFFKELFTEILSEKLPERENRSNPRVVKKPVSKFPTKKPEHRRTGGQQPLPAIRVRIAA